MKIVVYTLLTIFMCFGGLLSASARSKQEIKEGTILHCWCWSFNTIEKNLDKIAAAGFTGIQTIPANECLVGDYGKKNLMSTDRSGKWYYHYQPTDWKIGNYQAGTKEDFERMCAKAKSLDIAVIVDVVPNHTTPHKLHVSKDFIEAVGGMDKMYHKKGDRDALLLSDRLECTAAKIGSLPDVNTENPLFQAYFMKYLNELVDCGASGFRFDCAKHIALPDDPKDEFSPENDFWEIFTGRKAINGVMLKNHENLFMWGEVLHDKNTREDAYAKFLPVTASAYGKRVRSTVQAGKLLAKGLQNFDNAAGNEVVTWVESHDTYANAGESKGLTNRNIRLGWAVIAARKNGTPLFFNRPKGKEATQFPGESIIGETGNDEWFSKEVSAVNHFRTAMAGEDEEFSNGDDTGILVIKRGEKGLCIINAGDSNGLVSTRIALKDGTYSDKAWGCKFKVKDGVLSGKIPAGKVCVIY